MASVDLTQLRAILNRESSIVAPDDVARLLYAVQRDIGASEAPPSGIVCRCCNCKSHNVLICWPTFFDANSDSSIHGDLDAHTASIDNGADSEPLSAFCNSCEEHELEQWDGEQWQPIVTRWDS